MNWDYGDQYGQSGYDYEATEQDMYHDASNNGAGNYQTTTTTTTTTAAPFAFLPAF